MPTAKQIFYNTLISLISGISTFLFGIICYFALDITKVLPFIFWGYTLLVFVNLALFKIHKNLNISFITTAFLTYTGVVLVSLFSGGINSPMAIVLPAITIAGYIMKKRFGRYSIIAVLAGITILFILDNCANCVENYVPENSKSAFSLFSLTLATIMLGGVMGDFMAKSSYQVYKAKQIIEAQNNEKVILLKEIHHRVKNNLQIVMSLLKLQGYQLKDEKTIEVFEESRARIFSMALTHEMLYQGDEIANVGYNIYLERLINNLVQTLNPTLKKIKLELDVSNIFLKIDTAIPLGLLINEIITNSIKYGLCDTKESVISVTLKRINKSEYQLNISDNGRGFDEKIDAESTDSLGLQLIQTLTEQLDGTIKRFNRSGTEYELHFKEQ